MKWKESKGFLLGVLLLLCLCLLPLHSQGAEVGRLLSTLDILTEFDTSLDTLEKNTINSNRLIGNLQNQVSSLLNSIEKRQKELNQVWESYTLLEQTASQRFSDFENSLEYLGASYRESLRHRQVLERDNAELRTRIAQRTKVIVIMGSILLLIGGFFIWRKAKG